MEFQFSTKDACLRCIANAAILKTRSTHTHAKYNQCCWHGHVHRVETNSSCLTHQTKQRVIDASRHATEHKDHAPVWIWTTLLHITLAVVSTLLLPSPLLATTAKTTPTLKQRLLTNAHCNAKAFGTQKLQPRKLDNRSGL
eukprot:2413377-Amphidinium_carterae.2